MIPASAAAGLAVLAGTILLAGCTGPRSVIHSPAATPKGEWRVGGTLDVNVPTQTSAALYGGLERGVEALYDRTLGSDTARVPITADSLNEMARALVAYSLDPLGTSTSFHVRYGLLPRLDAGYRYAGGAHVLDARVQFLGPPGGEEGPGWRGSAALQFSSQSFELPSFFGKLQSLLRYEFKRKDILVPVVFGKPFGEGGRFGDFGVGGAWNLALIEYDSELFRVVERVDSATVREFEPIRGDRAIHAFGGFANLRLGFRYVFLIASFAAYRQDYGTFALFGGEETSLAGWTFVPTAGLEVRF